VITEIKQVGPKNNILVMKYFENNKISNKTNSLIFENVGVNLAGIHSLKCSGWGKVKKDIFLKEGLLIGKNRDFHSFLKEEFTWGIKYLESTLKFSSKQIAYLKLHFQKISEMDYEGLVCHGDLKPSHIIHDNREFIGFVDFDNVRIAPAIYDFCILYVYKKSLISSIIRGYESVQGNSIERDYIRNHSLVFSVPRISWEHKNGVLTKDYYQKFRSILKEVNSEEN